MPEAAVEHARTSLERIVSVLDRRENIPALEALVTAVRGGPVASQLSSSAIVIDANVFLRIPSHKKSADIMDYLTAVHEKPVVVPGQVIQEFWNNQLSAVDTVYKTISKKHSDMHKEVGRFKDSGVVGIELVSESLDAFKKSNEHVFEPEIMAKTLSFLERLVHKAIVPFAPRDPFAGIAVNRKRAKTPPGFKDDGDGDFLVWVDLLWGLSEAKADGSSFDSVILLSHDSKVDWSRGQTAHPVLVAETQAVLQANFEIWNLDGFAKAIEER
ncbi:PIN-like domain-containing protein [Nitratireductor indicus]|uniref:PIN-like domain-containing protein n=1 Tax=Nitratireductor indicus TaxID=721133 RepID=UPI002876AE9E|nr:PIN-like domain-containing protein [Nitratireductor indicus]MDS1136711.1 PIN-like domain-containing protein [Nitratireductor indicus]